MAVDEDKYKALYEYQKDQYEAECARFNRLEDKAVRYLGSATIAVSAYVLLLRWAAEKIMPPSGLAEWATSLSVVVTFAAMISAWGALLRSLRLQDLRKMPSGEPIVEYFKSNHRATIHLGLARKYAEAAKAKSEEYESKLRHVRKGYARVVLAGCCFVVSVVLIFGSVWIGESTVSDKKDVDQTSLEVPEEVDAPDLVPVFEGYREKERQTPPKDEDQ